ncbi:MAG: hypothetical protein CM15mP75_3280 [Flammeovirgaceae bacterium]|nr:MAG: hypothetical protein CM15mP75_3280 [Flammeovirgaceae bacterium]
MEGPSQNFALSRSYFNDFTVWTVNTFIIFII